MNRSWHTLAYRRNVVDMHIPDWDERFLASFDAETYVQLLKTARVQAAVLYAHSCVGLFNYPTKVGVEHANLRGRNLFGELVDRCHDAGFYVDAYCSLVYDRWAWDHDPDWRLIRADGAPITRGPRWGLCCPNSPYRDYVVTFAEEICSEFEVEGIRFDMTFWPGVCYCRHCEARHQDETGVPIPRVVDWNDPAWVRFQRARERWLGEFAELATTTAKRARPGITVEHQASTYSHRWDQGVTAALAEQNDFLEGDFYGDEVQGSMARKLFWSLSETRPPAFETSVVEVHLKNHTGMKSEGLLRSSAFSALADGCGFLFIDAIDPVGTLNHAVYERMGRIFGDMDSYQRELGGTPCQDVAVYFSFESKYDPADNGKPVDDPSLSTKSPHLDAVGSACRALRSHHVPFGVITKKNLDELSRYRCVVLPSVLMMDTEETDALRRYVADGGTLYATGNTSLTTKDGVRKADFMLADVLGVSHLGETSETFTYISPVGDVGHLFGHHTPSHPLGLASRQTLVDAHAGTEVLGTLTLPYTHPADARQFASIHSNPPGKPTNQPSIIRHRYGKGTTIYVATDLDYTIVASDLFVGLVRTLIAPGPPCFEADAPPWVEITMFHQPDRTRYIINLISFPKQFPDWPIHDITLRINLPDQTPTHITLLPDGETIPHEQKNHITHTTIPPLHTYHMLALNYQGT